MEFILPVPVWLEFIDPIQIDVDQYNGHTECVRLSDIYRDTFQISNQIIMVLDNQQSLCDNVKLWEILCQCKLSCYCNVLL